jgi:sigma-E factor negative regulatory protein RseB
MNFGSIVGGVFCLIGTAVAADDSQSWVQKMLIAQQSEPYVATMVIMSPPHALRGVHVVRSSEAAVESITGLNAPDAHWQMPMPALAAEPQMLAQQTAALSQSYVVSVATQANEMIASRTVQRLDFEPRDAWRFGYVIWLDKSSGLILQSSVIDRGVEVERMMVTDLCLHQKNCVPANAVVDLSSPIPKLEESSFSWRISNLPPGFSWRSSRLIGKREQALFGDGLASVSVWVEPLISGQPINTQAQRGSLRAMTRALNGARVTVLGDVPAETLVRIVNSMEVSKPK